MGFGKARVQADRQGDRRREKRAAQPAHPDGERLPDLWDVPGFVSPGSPRNHRTEPLEVLITDVRGNRVYVARKKKQHYRTTAPKPSVVWLWRPTKAPELWLPPFHHGMTHALRLLQAVSGKYEGDLRLNPGERVIRGEISPSQLLQACGAKESYANEVVALLCEYDLLHARNDNGQELWFVNTRVRGVGLDWELYTEDETPEGVLPEFLDNPPAQPVDDKGDDVTAQDEQVDLTTPLVRVFLWLGSKVKPDAEIGEGMHSFRVEGQLKDKAAEELNLSPSSVQQSLNKLTENGIYRSGRGPNPERWLKLVETSEIASLDQAPPPPPPPPSPTPPEETDDGEDWTAEQIQQGIDDLGDMLLEAHRENAELRELLEAWMEHGNRLSRELKELKAAKPTFRVKPELAELLRSK